MNLMDIAIGIIKDDFPHAVVIRTEDDTCICHLNQHGRGHFSGCWNYVPELGDQS